MIINLQSFYFGNLKYYATFFYLSSLNAFADALARWAIRAKTVTLISMTVHRLLASMEAPALTGSTVTPAPVHLASRDPAAVKVSANNAVLCRQRF